MTIRGLRRAPQVVLDTLASRTLSFWVMGAWVALATVWLVPFQLTGQPDATIVGIGNDWLPFRLTYAALLLTTATCALVRLRRDIRRARRPLPVDRALPPSSMLESPGTLTDAEVILGGMGFDTDTRDDRVVGIRRRWSVVGGSIFHLAVPLLAAGLVLHAATYGSFHLRLIEGQSADSAITSVKPGEGRWRELTSSIASLTLEQVRPAYFRDVLLFSRLDARILDQRSGERRTVSLASPAWLDPFTMISIQDFGFAPDVQLVEASGTVAEEVIGDLAVFPPGGQDTLRLPQNGYSVNMIVYPDYGVVDGRDVSLSYNLRNPRVLVGVAQDYPAGMIRARRLVRLGETVPGTDLLVRVKALRYYGDLRVWRSYGWPLLVISALLMLVGLVSRFLFPCEEIVVWQVADGLGMAARVDDRPGRVGGRAMLARVAGRLAPQAERSAPTPTRPGDRAARDRFAPPDQDALGDGGDEE